MRLLHLLAGLFLFAVAAHAADPVPASHKGTWSNREGAGGGTLTVARYRMGFDDDLKIQADYKVCTDANSQTATFENSEKPIVVSKRIAAGDCECFQQPEVLVFRNADSVTTQIFGTYEAFPAGSGCNGVPLTVSEPQQLPPISCSGALSEQACKAEDDSNLPIEQRPYCRLRFWHAARCVVSLPERRANYRVCTHAGSLMRADGSVYPLGLASIVTDSKLANRFPLDSGGQPLREFAKLTGDCMDLYQINQLEVLIRPFPVTKTLNPFSVKHLDLQLRTLGE